MDVRILGPLEVLDRRRPVSFRRGNDQALLAYLLLHANEFVASDRLVDELWGERPPPTASKILQNAVSQLRKALGDDRLLTRCAVWVTVGHGELERLGWVTQHRAGRGAGPVSHRRSGVRGRRRGRRWGTPPYVQGGQDLCGARVQVALSTI